MMNRFSFPTPAKYSFSLDLSVALHIRETMSVMEGPAMGDESSLSCNSKKQSAAVVA